MQLSHISIGLSHDFEFLKNKENEYAGLVVPVKLVDQQLCRLHLIFVMNDPQSLAARIYCNSWMPGVAERMLIEEHLERFFDEYDGNVFKVAAYGLKRVGGVSEVTGVFFQKRPSLSDIDSIANEFFQELNKTFATADAESMQ